MLAIAKSIKKVNDWIILLCAACPNLEKACELAGIKYANEVFLDKKYLVDGLPNFEANDVVDTEYSKKQLTSILSGEGVINEKGGITPLNFHSVHLNMKNANAIELAEIVKENVEAAPLSVSILEDKSWI